MNKRFYLSFIAMILITFAGFAQNKESSNATLTQNVRGIITDGNSGLPLAGVTVTLTTMPSKTAVTDSRGVFRMTGVLLGRHTIQISFLGYQPVTLSDVLVTTGKEAEVTAEIKTINKQLNEVMVKGGSNRKPLNQMAMSSGKSFSPEETNRYAGAMFDPARMAQSFAGVVAGGDNNEIIVRGNSPMSLQWRLEGIEIISPNHFGNSGASGGAVSMLNSTVLGKSDFYTGAEPAEYNNATAGVFDLRFRKGNTDKREYSFTAGILGVGATLEGPFKKGSDASYLVSYRYSTLDLLKKAGVNISSGNGVPKYQDLSFNIIVPTKTAGTFSLFGIGGKGALDDNAEHDYTKWDERSDAYNTDLTYSAGSIGLKHMYIANSKLYFSNIISYSADRSALNADTLTKTYQGSLVQKNHYDNSAIRYAGTVNYQVNSANIIRAGLNAGLLKYNLYDLEYKKESNALEQILDQKGNASTFDAYIENKHQFKGNVSLNTGVHVNYFNLSKTTSVEPRVGVNWQMTPSQLLTFATGMYSRLEPLSYYFATGPSQDQATGTKLSPTKSAQVVMGYEKQLSGHLKFKTEVYYQHLYNVPVSTDPLNNFSLLNVSDNSAIESSNYTSLVNKGTGKNYGVELSLEKSISDGYYFMVSTSIFDSKFKALSGQEFNTTFNTNYVANLVAGKEWATGKNDKNMFGLNGKLIYAGGRRYSPILLQESLKLDEQVIDQSKINTLTADPYIRVDFSASYRINRKKVSHYILLDIQNLLNRENNIGLWYNPSKRIVETNKWIGILPTINYRIEF